MITKILENLKAILGIAAGILLLITILLWVRNNNLKKDNNRLENNQIALTKDIEYYKTKSGSEAAKVMQLELKKGEFEKICSDQVKVIEDLKIKLKRVESMTSTGTVTEAGGKTQLKDTVVQVHMDTLYIDKWVKYFSWNDQWNKITGIINGNEVDCKYTGYDTLHIVAHRVPKKFLFFRFGTKYIEVSAKNSNPSTHIEYMKTIKVNK